MRPVIFAALAILVTLLSFQNCSNKLMTPDTPVIDYSSVQSIIPDCQFNRSGLMNGDTVMAFRTSSVPTGQMCVSEIRACRNGILSGTFEYAFCLPGAPAACLIDGRTIPSGGTIKVFQSATVGFGQKCDDVSQVRACNNGILSGNYTFSTCTTDKAKDCSYNGSIIANGQSKRYYRQSTVPFLGNCSAELRVCTNGSLSGTFTFDNCRAEGPVGCDVNGTAMTHGQTITFFNVNNVDFGKTCPVGLARTCSNGTVTGDANYKFTTCGITTAKSCKFNGQDVPHDRTVNAWSVSSVRYGDSCDPKKEVRRCNNGDLSGGFTFSGCRPGDPTLTCKTADNITMTHRQSLILYINNFVINPGTCQANARPELIFCDNGKFRSGSMTGSEVTDPRFANCDAGGREPTEWHGGRSYTYYDNIGCSGGRVTGIFYGADGRNPDIDSIGVFCNSSTSPGTTVGASRGNPGHARCTGTKNVVGVYGQDMGYLNYTITICANDDGTGREQTGEYGFNYGGSASVWYQMCKPGYVVNKLMVHAGDTVSGFNMECLQVAKPANIDCQGTWLGQSCQMNQFWPMNTEIYYHLQPKGGSGAACSIPEGTVRAGSTNCDVGSRGGGDSGG